MLLSTKLSSPQDLLHGLAERARACRLRANLSQEGLAQRAQVSLGTLKLFERTGKASIEFLLQLAFALGAEKEFGDLFPPQYPKSIEDVLSKPHRRRGTRK